MIDWFHPTLCSSRLWRLIDNVNETRQITIGEALAALDPVIESWNSQPAGTTPPTPNRFFFGELRPRKRGRGSQVMEVVLFVLEMDSSGTSAV